jgi:hypothetical protein
MAPPATEVDRPAPAWLAIGGMRSPSALHVVFIRAWHDLPQWRSAAMKMTKTERAELDKCTALAKKIRIAEQLVVRPADIVRDASMLLTFERTMSDRRDQALPSEVREVLELRLNYPDDYKARLERSRPAAERYG